MTESPTDEFYILSLHWTREDILTWWSPNNSGYTSILALAGRYTRAQIEAHPGYYNSDRAMAIPCAEVEVFAQQVVLGHAGTLAKLTGKRFRMTTDEDPEHDKPCERCGNERHYHRLGLEVVGDAGPTKAKASA